MKLRGKKLTEPPNETVPGPPQSLADPDPLLTFTYDVLDKQYRVYAWNDGKMQALITVNAALLAGLFYIVDKNVPHDLWSYALPLGSGVLLLSSLLVCLWHTVPRIDSGTPGGTHSLRTMKGIRGHTPAEYHSDVRKQSKPTLLEMNCRQIVGMNNNNYRSHDMMLWGVRLTIGGTLLLMASLVLFSATKQSTQRLVDSDRGALGQTVPVVKAPSASDTTRAGQNDSQVVSLRVGTLSTGVQK